MVKQDPYVKLTLHDGRFDEGGVHIGEFVKTGVKDNAGSNATFNETFRLNKPENMDVLRVELWDSDTLSDDLKGSVDVDLDEIYKKSPGKFFAKDAEVLKHGQSRGHIALRIEITA